MISAAKISRNSAASIPESEAFSIRGKKSRSQRRNQSDARSHDTAEQSAGHGEDRNAHTLDDEKQEVHIAAGDSRDRHENPHPERLEAVRRRDSIHREAVASGGIPGDHEVVVGVVDEARPGGDPAARLPANQPKDHANRGDGDGRDPREAQIDHLGRSDPSAGELRIGSALHPSVSRPRSADAAGAPGSPRRYRARGPRYRPLSAGAAPGVYQ
jgi:hypothetical protein